MSSTETNNRSQRFVGTLKLYTISNIGTRLLSFMLVPIYTFFLHSPAELGYFDLCYSIVLMLTPLVTLQLRDGIVRFLLPTTDEDKDRRCDVITLVVKLLSSSFFLWLIISCIFYFTYGQVRYFFESLMFLFALDAFEIYAQIIRGLGHNRIFAWNAVAATFLILVFTVIFLVVLKMGVRGIFLSNILARLIPMILIDAKLKIFSQYFHFNVSVKRIGREMLRFTLPIIPTAICWYFLDFAGRYFVKYFWGLEFNGLMAVSSRFSSVIYMMSAIFGQAWQETAILQYNKNGSEQFFSRIFSAYLLALSFVLVMYVFVVKSIYPFVVSGNYQSSWHYLFLMGVSACLSALASFFDLGYQCAKKTDKNVKPVLVAVVITCILYCVLIKQFNVYGLIVSNLICFLFLIIYRYKDTHEYFPINIPKFIILPVFFALASFLPFYFVETWWISLLCMMLALSLMAISIPHSERNMVIDWAKENVLKKFIH